MAPLYIVPATPLGDISTEGALSSDLKKAYDSMLKLNEITCKRDTLIALLGAAQNMPQQLDQMIKDVRGGRQSIQVAEFAKRIVGADEGLVVGLVDKLTSSKKKLAPGALREKGLSAAIFASVSGPKRTVIAEKYVSDSMVRDDFCKQAREYLEKLEEKIKKHSRKAKPLLVSSNKDSAGLGRGRDSVDPIEVYQELDMAAG